MLKQDHVSLGVVHTHIYGYLVNKKNEINNKIAVNLLL